jgi:hypothetical protein
MSAASMTFLLTSTLLKLCAATNKCGCSGVHDLDHLRTNGLRDVGERGHGVAIAQKTSIARGLVVENQRSVERTTARRRHPIFLLGLRNFEKSTRRKCWGVKCLKPPGGGVNPVPTNYAWRMRVF